jgi:hypothetical protein
LKDGTAGYGGPRGYTEKDEARAIFTRKASTHKDARATATAPGQPSPGQAHEVLPSAPQKEAQEHLKGPRSPMAAELAKAARATRGGPQEQRADQQPTASSGGSQASAAVDVNPGEEPQCSSPGVAVLAHLGKRVRRPKVIFDPS